MTNDEIEAVRQDRPRPAPSTKPRENSERAICRARHAQANYDGLHNRQDAEQ